MPGPEPDIFVSSTHVPQGSTVALLVALLPPSNPLERAAWELSSLLRRHPVAVHVDPPGSGPTERCSVFRASKAFWRSFVAFDARAEPGPWNVKVTAGCWPFAQTTRRFPVFVTPRAYPHADITGGPPTSWRMAGRERRAHAALRASRTQERHWRGEPFALPCKAQHPAEKAGVGKGAKLKGKAVRVDDHDGPTITAEYGQRRSYNGVEAADGYFHEGVDFACEQGTFVRATQAGKVALVGRERDGFAVGGNTVALDHGQGVVTLYMHLNEAFVAEGAMVEKGQVLGSVGSTGLSTGPHLHWGMYVGGKAVDPLGWTARWGEDGVRRSPGAQWPVWLV